MTRSKFEEFETAIRKANNEALRKARKVEEDLPPARMDLSNRKSSLAMAEDKLAVALEEWLTSSGLSNTAMMDLQMEVTRRRQRVRGAESRIANLKALAKRAPRDGLALAMQAELEGIVPAAVPVLVSLTPVKDCPEPARPCITVEAQECAYDDDGRASGRTKVTLWRKATDFDMSGVQKALITNRAPDGGNAVGRANLDVGDISGSDEAQVLNVRHSKVTVPVPLFASTPDKDSVAYTVGKRLEALVVQMAGAQRTRRQDAANGPALTVSDDGQVAYIATVGNVRVKDGVLEVTGRAGKVGLSERGFVLEALSPVEPTKATQAMLGTLIPRCGTVESLEWEGAAYTLKLRFGVDLSLAPEPESDNAKADRLALGLQAAEARKDERSDRPGPQAGGRDTVDKRALR